MKEPLQKMNTFFLLVIVLLVSLGCIPEVPDKLSKHGLSVSNVGKASSIPSLRKAMDDPEWRTRVLAMNYLNNVESSQISETVPKLTQTIADTNERKEVRGAAIRALNHVVLKTSARGEEISHTFWIGLHDEDDRIRNWSVTGLQAQRRFDPEIQHRLEVMASQDSKFEVRENATSALEFFKNTQGKPLNNKKPVAVSSAIIVNIVPPTSVVYRSNTTRAPTIKAEAVIQSDIDSQIPIGHTAGRFDVAVVVGNADYLTDGVPNVDYALNDARTMRRYLEKTLGYHSENILYQENATYAAMNQLFGSDRDHRGKLFNYVKPNESRVFIYYVGHGAPDLDTGEAYFVPVDTDPQYMKSTGYRLQTFYHNIAKLPAKDITIVLDSCFSGGSQKGMLFKGISPAMVKVQKETVGPKNALIFTSGRNDQVSTWYPEKGHSLFTYYFLKGLQGDADHDGNRILTVSEMDNYLADNVPYMARRLSGREQHPQTSGDQDKEMVRLN